MVATPVTSITGNATIKTTSTLRRGLRRAPLHAIRPAARTGASLTW